MGDEFTKKTRDTLGKIIKKPPLTDKLLVKPPFRFLHDIFTEVIKTTGFLNGLFTASEMDSKNVSVKEDKMAFLQKVIDVVSLVSGQQLSAKPIKIVAGHEPEKTNELLQAIAKCVHKNVSSDEAVQQVLSGKKSSSKVQEKPPTGSSKKREGKENRERSEDGKERRKKKDRDDDKHERERSSDRRKRSAGKERSERSRDKESNKEQGEGSEEKERERSREKPRDKDRRKEDRSRDRRERKKRDEDSERNEMESGGRSRDGDGEEERPQAPDNQEEQEDTNEKPASSRPPRPASAKGHRRRPAPDRGSRGSAPDGQDSSPSDKSRSRPARPPSARPAAPRVRQRPDAAEEEIARMESAGRQRTAPIIVDRGSRPGGEGISSSEDDDEQFLVQEEDIQPPEMGKLSPMLNGNMNGEGAEEEDGEHGGLVRKILETKKELESSASKGTNAKKRTEIERPAVNEVQRRKEREIVVRDIEKLRASVQKLCRTATPLGKVIDYIQEDMDSMQNEIIQWKKENKEHAAKLKEEESITIKTIEPLQAELEELDRSIASQLDMIAASKCNVFRNQEKIDKMVAGVTAQS